MLSKFVKKARHGFTLVEIMIVVLIIGILLAIAVPNFIRARESSRAKSCQSNLKQIDSAKEQYAMDKKLNKDDSVELTDLVGTDGYIKSTPSCPSGGDYTPNGISVNPECSIGDGDNDGDTFDDHTLP
jgi:prepilin-type N-terminal cleavage/methylation domain-containing protein